MAKIKEFVRSGNSVIFDGDYLDIYIDRDYFKRGMAEHQGNYISTVGMFQFEIKTEAQVKGDKPGVLKSIKYPNRMEFDYSEHFTYEGKLGNEKKSLSYDVFRLTKGDKFLANVNIEQSAVAVKDFVFMLHGGKIPGFVAYSDIIKLYHDALNTNKVNLKSNSLTYELIISELCRAKSDIEVPYRKSLKKNPSEYDYVSINLKEIPRINSTFTALTFENIDESIISSVKRTNTGGEETPSPLESVIKY